MLPKTRARVPTATDRTEPTPPLRPRAVRANGVEKLKKGNRCHARPPCRQTRVGTRPRIAPSSPRDPSTRFRLDCDPRGSFVRERSGSSRPTRFLQPPGMRPIPSFFDPSHKLSGFLMSCAFMTVLAGECLEAQTLRWQTIAGTPGGSGSTDGPGGTAKFSDPKGLAVDVSGNIYVADENNHTIRKISPQGIVSTLAGAPGVPGSSDGQGSAARFRNPSGVAVDLDGNVYVADRDNNTIRKVTPAGAVTTLAGSPEESGDTDGLGSAARFAWPRDVAVDGSGTVYVADELNHVLRKITSAGLVSTLAGTPGVAGAANGTGVSARFTNPRGVAVDVSGNVYVADEGNQLIRKVNPAGVVTTMAGGSGISGSADGDAASARFNGPSGIAVDGGGNVYVADEDNHTVRMVTPQGIVSTLGGSPGSPGSSDGIGGAARFDEPRGIEVNESGVLYVADTGNHRITQGTLIPKISVLGSGRFPSIRLGQSKVKVLRITNLGSSTVSDLRVSASGPAARSFRITGPARGPLPPGATTGLKVTFRPKKTGVNRATLVVSSGAVDVKTSLSGVGKK
jgi:sugar lactone lactonase YvrE